MKAPARRPVQDTRIEAKAIEPCEDFRPSNEADILRQMAERRARWVDADHAEALRTNAAIDRPWIDVDLERRADRRDAEQMAIKAEWRR